jgi:hypothetical protein
VIHSVILHPTYFSTIVQLAALVQFEGKIVWEVCDNFQKQTYRNRTIIVTDKGKLLLSIPIQHQGEGRRLSQSVVSDPSERWNELHWKSIVTAYRSSPFFEFYEAELQPLFSESEVNLLDHGILTCQFLCTALGISHSVKRTQNYQKYYSDVEVIDLRAVVNAKESVAVHYPPYPQVFDATQPFCEGVCALDLLFNLGPKEARTYLEALDISSLF